MYPPYILAVKPYWTASSLLIWCLKLSDLCHLTVNVRINILCLWWKFLFNTLLYICWHSQDIVISEVMVRPQGFSVTMQQLLWRPNLTILCHSLHDHFVSDEITGKQLWLILAKKKNQVWYPWIHEITGKSGWMFQHSLLSRKSQALLLQ